MSSKESVWDDCKGRNPIYDLQALHDEAFDEHTGPQPQLRCSHCSKLLGIVTSPGGSEIEIQCPRCKTKNHISY